MHYFILSWLTWWFCWRWYWSMSNYDVIFAWFWFDSLCCCNYRYFFALDSVLNRCDSVYSWFWGGSWPSVLCDGVSRLSKRVTRYVDDEQVWFVDRKRTQFVKCSIMDHEHCYFICLPVYESPLRTCYHIHYSNGFSVIMHSLL